MSRPLVVFDLDHTLISVDSSSLWSRYLVRHGIATASNFLQSEEELMAAYARGEMDIQNYVTVIMKPLEKIPINQVDDIVVDFVDSDIMPRVYPQAWQLIQSLQQQEQKILIISASVSLLVRAIASRLAITDAIGIDVIIKDGYYSDRINGVASYQQGKVTRLQQWLKDNPDYSGELTFYTDSINDLPLCQHANVVFVVNPCQRLAQAANRGHWPVLAWQH